eukprot:CAMPEP_0182470700 /NCGR_PEP_ID=MMETSP1319-20130603/19108_1 /TAXON_ID=172717 /ORGANISM="Bolidomonas pacifica, Strain RCC208" /LENGTH=185 /DNA_ID=CAMNT_0024671173 /DNA_START=30 /DNA_END=583 /DNA_ORIENTATION=-
MKFGHTYAEYINSPIYTQWYCLPQQQLKQGEYNNNNNDDNNNNDNKGYNNNNNNNNNNINNTSSTSTSTSNNNKKSSHKSNKSPPQTILNPPHYLPYKVMKKSIKNLSAIQIAQKDYTELTTLVKRLKQDCRNVELDFVNGYNTICTLEAQPLKAPSSSRPSSSSSSASASGLRGGGGGCRAPPP